MPPPSVWLADTFITGKDGREAAAPRPRPRPPAPPPVSAAWLALGVSIRFHLCLRTFGPEAGSGHNGLLTRCRCQKQSDLYQSSPSLWGFRFFA